MSDDLRFDWDPRKDASNRKKHRVSFGEARTVFYDERALVIEDPDHSESEERFVILGLSALLRLLVVCHCYRQAGGVVRIISARKANAGERKQYESGVE